MTTSAELRQSLRNGPLFVRTFEHGPPCTDELLLELFERIEALEAHNEAVAERNMQATKELAEKLRGAEEKT